MNAELTTGTDSNPKNVKSKPLKGTFAPEAKQRITEFLQSFHSFEPTLGLLYGDLEGLVTGSPSWSITALDSVTVEEMVGLYESFGATVCYELDGFQVVIPQVSRIAELDGGVLGFTQNRLSSVQPSDG
jgi:hypothetical protein